MRLSELNFELKRIPNILVDRILEQGQGNPFYIEELLNFIHDQSIDLTDIQALAALELPTSLHNLILSRVDQLSDQQQITLKVASVIGRIFQAALLWGMYPRAWVSRTGKTNLVALSQMQLTTQDPSEQELTYFFKQIVTQQVAYETLPYATRALLHNQLALFIEKTYLASVHQFIDLLAFHFFRGENWPRALHFNLQAAERDLHEFANEAAISACQNVLQAAYYLPAQDTLLERLQTQGMLGELYTITGRYDQALEAYEIARQLSAERPISVEKTSQQARFCRKTAEVYERRNEFERAFSWLREGLAFIDPEQPNNEAARIYHLGAGIYERLGNYTEAIAWCQQSLEIASRLPGSDAQLSIAHVNMLLGAIHNRLAEFSKAIAYCHQSLQTFNALSDFVGLARAYNNLGINFSDQGDWEQSSQAYDKSLEINVRIGAIQEIGLVSNNLGNIHMYRGDWDRAITLFQQSNAIWKQLGALLFDAVTLINLAQVYIYRGDLELSQHILTESEHNLKESGGEGFMPELERRWAEFFLRKGDLELALQHGQQSVKLAEKQQDRFEAGKSLGVLGEIYSALQEPDQAWQALNTSLETLISLNSEYEAARVQLKMAKLAVQWNDPNKGMAYLQAAKPVFEKLGARADLATALELENSIT
jgi:adenylate cyclase